MLTVAGSKSRGRYTAEDTVKAYLEMLSRRDTGGLKRLAPADYYSDDTLRQKVEEYGGSSFEDVTIEMNPMVNPSFMKADVRGKRTDTKGNRLDYFETLDLEMIGNRWYILLGSLQSLSPPVNGQPLPTL